MAPQVEHDEETPSPTEADETPSSNLQKFTCVDQRALHRCKRLFKRRFSMTVEVVYAYECVHACARICAWGRSQLLCVFVSDVSVSAAAFHCDVRGLRKEKLRKNFSTVFEYLILICVCLFEWKMSIISAHHNILLLHTFSFSLC